MLDQRLRLHAMNGHCNHTSQISSATDSQNTQHHSFLRFEIRAAFSQQRFILYSPYYTHLLQRINYFVQDSNCSIVQNAQFRKGDVHCRKTILQCILHFCACIASRRLLQNSGAPDRIPTNFCRNDFCIGQITRNICRRTCIICAFSCIFAGEACKKTDAEPEELRLF